VLPDCTLSAGLPAEAQMPLPRLVPAGDAVPVAVQETSLAVDALARNVCNTWQEATANGGPPFSVVVVGAGAYGGYLAAKLAEFQPQRRVLLLEAGPFLVGEHVQNLGPVGLGIPPAIDPAQDPLEARDLVWGLPWRGNTPFPGTAYCCGGKSLYWGGWCPRLTPADLARWPAPVAADLQTEYDRVESELGVVPGTDFLSGDLLAKLQGRVDAVVPGIPDLDLSLPGGPVEAAPIAVQGSAPASGLFSFDKYSSLPLLVAALRRDSERAGFDDAKRRLFLVPRCHVIRVVVRNGIAEGLEVDAAGSRTTLPLGPGTRVVLAAGAIETTRIALLSAPTPLMGRNLMAHLRTDLTFRIRRTALPSSGPLVQTAALLVRGATAGRRFHLQLTASTSAGGSDALLYQMIPDLDMLDEQLANVDPAWVTLTVRGIGEMAPDTVTPAPNDAGSWMDLSPYEVDEYVVPRAYVHLQLRPGDLATWTAMDRTAQELAMAIAGAPQDIQYRYDDGWQTQPYPLQRPFPGWHWGLGTTYHEAGTLWMGASPADSVTTDLGRLHHVQNLYACDQSLFPTVASVNPVLTGTTLARRLARLLP
jgi:hypothetical protein